MTHINVTGEPYPDPVNQPKPILPDPEALREKLGRTAYAAQFENIKELIHYESYEVEKWEELDEPSREVWRRTAVAVVIEALMRGNDK